MSGRCNHLDRAIEAVEIAMNEVSKASGQIEGPKMYGLNRLWHGLDRTAEEMRAIRDSLTKVLPTA